MSNSDIRIIELPGFDKRAHKIFSDEEFCDLCNFLTVYPDKGDVISGTGGIRKIRWSAGGKGKRGGARVIYYYHVVGTQILLMDVYTKKEQADLTPQAKKALKQFINEFKKSWRPT